MSTSASLRGAVLSLALTFVGTAEAADAARVTVTNPLAAPRWSETVALDFAALQKLVPALTPARAVVLDVAGKLVDTQLVDMNGDEAPDQLLFQTELGAKQSRSFSVQPGERRPPTRDQFKVYGRFVRERHDDFAWENDRVAHRMYGPALEKWQKEPLTTSGVDVWVKRPTRRVINDWYMVGDYHRDSGEGADLYSVGASRGCGGLGVWSAGELHVSRNFVSSRVLAGGPLRLVFELDYAAWDAGGVTVSETKRVILDAGKHFGRFESTFRVESGKGPLAIGVGIARHAGGSAEVDPRWGILRAFEPLKEDNGNLGCAVVLGPGKVQLAPRTEHDSLLVTPAPAQGPLAYYVGSAWDKATDVANDGVWARRVERFAKEAFHPVRVSLAPAAALPLPASVLGNKSWSVRLADSVMERAKGSLTARWSYDNGVVMKGLLRVWQKTREPKYFDYVKRTIDGLVDGDGAIKGYRLEDYDLDPINNGKVLLVLLTHASDAKDKRRYEKALATLRAQLAAQPRTREGGFWHKQLYPSQMWLDGIYMAAPFLVEYALKFGEPALLDEVAKQILLIEKHTRDPKTGLLYHGWDDSKQQKWANPKTGTSPEFWGRAMGWYAMALVDVLELFPTAHPRRAAIQGVLERLAAAVAAVQDRATGVWWQVLNEGGREHNYREASATAMFVYALEKAVKNGWLERGKYEPVARRGYQGLAQAFLRIDGQGRVELGGTCKVAGLGGDPYRDGSYAYYTAGTELQLNDPKGIGAVLLASVERE